MVVVREGLFGDPDLHGGGQFVAKRDDLRIRGRVRDLNGLVVVEAKAGGVIGLGELILPVVSFSVINDELRAGGLGGLNNRGARERGLPVAVGLHKLSLTNNRVPFRRGKRPGCSRRRPSP